MKNRLDKCNDRAIDLFLISFLLELISRFLEAHFNDTEIYKNFLYYCISNMQLISLSLAILISTYYYSLKYFKFLVWIFISLNIWYMIAIFLKPGENLFIDISEWIFTIVSIISIIVIGFKNRFKNY